MIESKSTRESINKLQVLIGLISLFIGVLVYFLDRPAEGTYFIYRFGFMLKLHNIINEFAYGSFGDIGSWLPEFIHVFSFILLTAGILSSGKKGCVIICVAWFLIDCTFELGQAFSSLSLKLIPDWFSDVPILESMEGFFRKGTFDIKDLVAVLIGTIGAYFVLLITMGSGREQVKG